MHQNPFSARDLPRTPLGSLYAPPDPLNSVHTGDYNGRPSRRIRRQNGDCRRIQSPNSATIVATVEQQRFTIQSGVLTSTSSRQRGAIIGRPLPERTDFGPAVAARQNHLCPSQPHYGLHPAMFSGNDSLV